MIYDQQYVSKYRALAITNVEDIVEGGVYYGRHGDEFTIVKLMTNAQYYAFRGLEWEYEHNANEIGWMLTNNDYISCSASLADNNIGASYNPWLIFKDKKTAMEYYDGLKIDYDDEFFYSDFDWTEEDYFDTE